MLELIRFKTSETGWAFDPWLPLTYELHGLVQPGQDLLTEAVVDGHAQEVRVGDEVRFGTRVAGVQDEHDVVLLHQVLQGGYITFIKKYLINDQFLVNNPRLEIII